MALTMTGVITGAAVTGLTSPTFTLIADTSVSMYGKRSVVDTIGGTQPGVLKHSFDSQFYIDVKRPSEYKKLGTVNPVTGQLRDVPKNTFAVHIGKGAIPAVNQPAETVPIKIEFRIPAGTVSYSENDVKAEVSLLIGWLTANKDNLVQWFKDGNT